MKCKHSKLIADCDPCLSKILKKLQGNEPGSDITFKSGSCEQLYASHSKYSCDVCYANAFISFPALTSTVIKTFTQEELLDPANTCITIPLTSSCDGGLLQLGQCQTPSYKWCKIVDQGNGFITSLQVPKNCGGCYNFDLSCSISLDLEGTVNIPGTGLTTVIQNFPANITLKLSEQLQREVCIADEAADFPESCFTSVLVPIIDSPMITQTTGNIISLVFLFSLVFTPVIHNLSVSGIICLKGCQKLIPSVTLKLPSSAQVLFTILSDTFSNLKLKISLYNLSLKLVRVGNCDEACDCKRNNH